MCDTNSQMSMDFHRERVTQLQIWPTLVGRYGSCVSGR